MDQFKIGKFIAERRKAVGLTQLQLADALHLTDKAVSKWETGKAMPDSSIMLKLCGILKITVNELLSGEVINMENNNEQMEKKLLELIKEKEECDKRLLKLEVVIGVLSSLVLFIPVIIGALVPAEEWIKTVIVFSGFIPAFFGFFYAVKIEQVAGYYKCKNCANTYVPTYKDVSLAPHMGRTRYMCCPKCNKKSWHKKVINKD